MDGNSFARFHEHLADGILAVEIGLVWTTDAPYRETPQQIKQHSHTGALAVEMQAASLFASGAARGFPVGVIAHVTNAVGHTEEQFDKGDAQLGYEILKAICRETRLRPLTLSGELVTLAADRDETAVIAAEFIAER